MSHSQDVELAIVASAIGTSTGLAVWKILDALQEAGGSSAGGIGAFVGASLGFGFLSLTSLISSTSSKKDDESRPKDDESKP